MKRLIILAVAAMAAANPALAGQPVTLKADTFDADGTVTLSDLFDGASGPAGRVVLANRTGASLVLDAPTVQAVAARAGLDWANAEGLHKIVVRGAVGGEAAAGGPARANVEVLTYARSLSAGEIVQPADLVWAKLAAAPADAPTDAAAVIGQAAKRPLRAGAPVSGRDIGSALVTKSGDMVTVTYEADGVVLALQGKAMSSAGVGETISVQNPTSKKIIQALLTGPGEAIVGPNAEAVRATLRPARFAAR